MLHDILLFPKINKRTGVITVVIFFFIFVEDNLLQSTITIKASPMQNEKIMNYARDKL